MAWVTAIVASEQVDYRLSRSAGCHVPEQSAPAADAVVDYRLRPEADSALVWLGSGLEAVGLTAGQPLDEDGTRAARLLMNGCSPATGARLVRSEARAHPEAMLPAARLLEVIEAAATDRGVADAAELLEGKPKQQRQLATVRRQVNLRGEAYRLQVDTLHRLARAAGVTLEDAYGTEELARAREHQEQRVDVRVRGWDLVGDVPKSVSVLHGLLPAGEERELRDLVHQAKREAFAQLEDWIGYAVGSEDGQRVRLATGGLLGWSVEHQAARPVDDTPGDPHLHLHLVVANMALCEDGKWRSIANSGQDLHRHARAFDGLFKARVRTLLSTRFGVRWEQDARTGAWEVAGIPEGLRAAFSRRAAEVDRRAGADADRDTKARVSQATRHAKHDLPSTDLRASWRERADELVDVDAMLAAAAPGPDGPTGGPAAPGPGPRIPPPADLAAVVFDRERGLTAHEKEFSRAQLLAAVAHALPEGIGPRPQALEELADAVLGVPGYAVALPPRGSAVMSSTGRFTTEDVLAAEAGIVTAARERYADGSAQLTTEQAAAALDVFEVTAGFALSPEQRAVVERLLTAGHGLDAVVGVAGAGKTTLMTACRIGWDAAGLTTAGACLSAVAAAGLESESGIPSRTVAAWLRRIEDGSGLAGIDVLVLDEAAMVDDRALAVLLEHAAATGTKVIAIGDPQQLRAIGPGGGFAEVHRLVGGETLRENRRQRDAGERAALEVWRSGERETALRMLADGGRVHAAGSAEEARVQLLAAWDAARTGLDARQVLEQLVVLAARNTDVDALNAGARAIRRAAGELGDDHHYALPGGERLVLAEGDLVRVRQNDYRSRRGAGPDVLNGCRAVVAAIDAEHRVQIAWTARDTGEAVSAWLTPDQIAGGALSHGYALTIAASQGMTTGTSLVYGHGADANGLYPALTRGKAANHLWLPLAALEEERTAAALGPARSEREQLDRAVAAYADLLAQTRPDAMVSDQLRPAPEPAAAPAPADTTAAGIPAWTERRYGAVPTGQLAARADRADAEAARIELLARGHQEQADQLAAVLGTDASPAAARTAKIAARIDRIAHHADQAAAAERALAEQHETLDLYRTRVRQIGHRLTLRRSALLGERGELREARTWLEDQISRRTAAAGDLRAVADDHRRQALLEMRELPDNMRPTHLHTADPAAVAAAARQALPEHRQRADATDARALARHQSQAREYAGQAALHREAAAAYRAEASLRRTLTDADPHRAAVEVRDRVAAAQLARQRSEAALQQAARQQSAYQPPPPSQGLRGPRR